MMIEDFLNSLHFEIVLHNEDVLLLSHIYIAFLCQQGVSETD